MTGHVVIKATMANSEDGRAISPEKDEVLLEPTVPVENNQVTDVFIEASEIVNRLEKVAEGNNNEDHDTILLGVEKKSAENILQSIHNFLKSDHQTSEPPVLHSFGDSTKYILSMHTLAAYCNSLDKDLIQKFSIKILSDTNRWLGQMFGFPDCEMFYHTDEYEGLQRIIRMLLYYRYPKFAENGALIFTDSHPSIYISSTNNVGIIQQVCRQIGLPISCIRLVPANNYGKMDVTALQKMLADDVSVEKNTPLIIIADAGISFSGYVDNVTRIRELCKLYDCWFHLKGHSLAILALVHRHTSGEEISTIVDSCTLPVGNWIGFPSLSTITIYKLPEKNICNLKQLTGGHESTALLLAGLHNDVNSRVVKILPIWTTIQYLGRDGIFQRFMNTFVSCEQMWLALNRYRHLRILSQKPAVLNSDRSLADILLIHAEKIVNIPDLFEATACCVSFQFIPEGERAKVPIYYDRLNMWLGQNLRINTPNIPLDIFELENIGVTIRFCPFDGSTATVPPGADDIQTFIEYLEQQLIILHSTIQYRGTFVALVDESPVLRLVELPDWAGLGGVRYVPEGWEQFLTDQAKDELNTLNMRLVEALRSTDAAFSLGEDQDGLLCVRFGMLTSQSDVEELLGLVVRVGQSVEESSRVLDSMAEVVRRGIETATLDLQRENDERLWQEGILRQVPVVGTFVNWWSPLAKDSGGVRGRSLNLTQGVVESTENIYKYHMQSISGAQSTHGGKSPPTPQVQLDVGGQHSRSSSHTSSQTSYSKSDSLDTTKNSSQNTQQS